MNSSFSFFFYFFFKMHNKNYYLIWFDGFNERKRFMVDRNSKEFLFSSFGVVVVVVHLFFSFFQPIKRKWKGQKSVLFIIRRSTNDFCYFLIFFLSSAILSFYLFLAESKTTIVFIILVFLSISLCFVPILFFFLRFLIFSNFFFVWKRLKCRKYIAPYWPCR